MDRYRERSEIKSQKFPASFIKQKMSYQVSVESQNIVNVRRDSKDKVIDTALPSSANSEEQIVKQQNTSQDETDKER